MSQPPCAGNACWNTRHCELYLLPTLKASELLKIPCRELGCVIYDIVITKLEIQGQFPIEVANAINKASLG